MRCIDIISEYADRCRCDELLAPYTTWRIGGPAEILLEPQSLDDILHAWQYAKSCDKPITVIGRGSNVLIDDAGIPGVVICTRKSLDDISTDADRGIIRASVGCTLPKLTTAACKWGIAGYEFLAGIPGTVGGAIVTNAGIGGPLGPSLKDLLDKVMVLDLSSGEIYSLLSSELELGYRYSNISKRKIIILYAEFRCPGTDAPAVLKDRLKEIISARKKLQPDEPYTAGSVFKRPVNGEPAGWYIDQAGLKGIKIGGAVISRKHANWIINDGTAVSGDVHALIDLIRDKVMAEFGIELELEIRILPQDYTES